MKQITAKFNSKCAETGKTLRKGDMIYFDVSTRKAYHPSAKIVCESQTDDGTGAYIRAQEEAYWDRATGYYYSR